MLAKRYYSESKEDKNYKATFGHGGFYNYVVYMYYYEARLCGGVVSR